MFDTLCTYPLPSDLFALAIHPTSPLLALGLASGHVQLNRIPPSHTTPPSRSKKSNKPPPAVNTISTAWSTRRHKTSCRSLTFSQPDGAHLFSTGTDSLVKLADTETGRVIDKIAVPNLSSNSDVSQSKSKIAPDTSSLLHVFDPHCLLLATDSAALHLYDVRENPNPTSSSSLSLSSKPQQIYHPHADYVTSITSLPSPSSTSSSTSNTTANKNKATTSPSPLLPSTQFISTGATTVAITDTRRGTLIQSAPQDEELLSSTLCGDRVVVGGERGILRIWDVGKWDDSEIEIAVAPRLRGGASADALSAFSKSGDDGDESMVAVGMDDGVIRFVDLANGGRSGGKRGRVLLGEEMRHDEIEGVSGLGFLSGDASGRRMVSGGGSVVRIWGERGGDNGDGEEEVEEEEEEEEAVNGKKRMGDDDDDDDEREASSDDEDENEDDDEDEAPKRRKKKRKRGKIRSVGQQQVMKFKGLD